MTFQKKIWFGFISAIAIIAWLAINSYRNNKETSQSVLWVAHANQVLFHSEQILSLIVDLESGQRGYALTGIEEFLEPTKNSIQKLNEHTAKLRELTSDDSSQERRTGLLDDYINEKISFTAVAIETRRNKGPEEAKILNASLAGKRLTDRIRGLIGDIQGEEKNLLVERTAMIEQRVNVFNQYYVAMLAATVIILIILFYTIYVNLKGREEAERSLRKASRTIEDIYHNAPCGYHSVNADGTIIEINDTFLAWLQYKKTEVANKMKFRDILTVESANDLDVRFEHFKKAGILRDVEYQVVRKDGTTFFILVNATAVYDNAGNFLQSRSTVLDYTDQRQALHRIEQLNRELESFSYSVSHDLRAPLRSIDGYTQILLEDHSGQLDGEGTRLLQVVVNNARRMGKLIDDLLDFSRVTRKDILKTNVNTENMVQSIIIELKALEPNRNIEVVINELVNCQADPGLLRQVWFNLLSNAFKYTRKNEKAMIEVGSDRRPGETLFSVKDNGTGFEMQYSDKLFGVFQRLHRQNEFEGTGVGLAIVHRIINRHGGTIWANAELNKGATFTFTLPIT